MSVKYGKFEIPETITIEESTATPTFARFTAEPFERGFGHTVGNSLRRMMLSSLEAPAIISILFEGVPHEYMAIEGVVEDMTNIILNLKGALLRRLPLQEESIGRAPTVLTKVLNVTAADLGSKGSYQVKLRDLIDGEQFEIVNPELHIFTITQPFAKRIDLKIAIGRGYVPSERHSIHDKIADEIIVDSAFSPVRLVNYTVENTRVGQDTDYDRLIIDVTTDGRVSPQEALSFAAKIGIKHLGVFDKIQAHDLIFEKGEAITNSDREEMLAKLALRIGEIELSVRSTNCLNGAGIQTIGELVVMREPEMLQFRNFGKKSLGEIRAKLEEMHLAFGTDLSQYGIDRDNVKDEIQKYLHEKEHREEEEGGKGES
jgi:DNA-directed RNA polymerase subunit alpha